MRKGTGILAMLAVSLAGGCAAPAVARDACLVGSWTPLGNGAADWVRRQAPGMRMAITQQAANLRLDVDGSYRAQAQVEAEASGPSRRARSNAAYSASGSWTSADGRLTLAPATSASRGAVEVGPGDGRSSRMALPAATAQPAMQEYSCSGDTLETRMRIPGSADPIVQRYRRQ